MCPNNPPSDPDDDRDPDDVDSGTAPGDEPDDDEDDDVYSWWEDSIDDTGDDADSDGDDLWSAPDETVRDSGEEEPPGGERGETPEAAGSPSDPDEVDSSYRSRGTPDDSGGAPDEPDPDEPLDLDFEHDDPGSGDATSTDDDGDFGGVWDDDDDTGSRSRARDGADRPGGTGDVDVEATAEELREEMADSSGATADSETPPGGTGDTPTAEEGADGGDSEESVKLPGGVLATSISSPATSDEILDELEDPELSGVERVAEGVVDAADQVSVGDGSDTSWLDTYAYRQFGPWVRRRADQFAEYRATVNEARLEETYDEYLARVIMWTVLFSAVGAFVGATFTTTLIQTGLLSSFSLNIPVGTRLAAVMKLLRVPVAYLVSMLVTGGVFGGLVGVTMYSAPQRRASQREREIEYLLPQVVTYMYALSQGQLSIPAIIRQVAGDEDTYGEVAREFQAVVNEMDYRGRDLRAALRAARAGTPSDELGILLDDMINVESTGGKLSPFFKDKVEKYQYEARRQKRQYLDTLEQFAELYVTVAAVMVFVITIAAIYVSITGEGVVFLALLLYVALPLLSVGGWAMMDMVSLKSLATTETLREDDEMALTVDDVATRLRGALPNAKSSAGMVSDGGAVTGTANRVVSRTAWSHGDLSAIEATRLSSLQTALRRQRVLDVLMLPIRRVTREPLLSAVFSLPVVLLYLTVMVATGAVSPTVDAMTSQPAWTTTATVVIPLVIVLTPISVFHELDRRRDEKANAQLPGLLRKLAAATDSGATLSGAIAIVANSSDTYLSRELHRAHVESSIWNVPRNEALVRMTDRVRSPRLARVFQLITEASGSTEYLRDILEIAAQDVRTAHRLESDRQADMQKYMVIIVGANIAFLLISVILAVMIVPRMTLQTQAAPEVASATAGSTTSLLFGETPPTSLIQMFFLHGALMLGLTSGLLAGKLGDDNILTGVKIAIVKIILVAITFLMV